MHSSLENFLDEVLASRTLTAGMSVSDLEDAIYNLYTPPPAPGISQDWNQVSYHGGGWDDLADMGWRIYISAQSASLMTVWQRLQPIFRRNVGVVAAKHTTVAAAATRVDTIVVYLKTLAGTKSVIEGIKGLFASRASGSAAPDLPPKLTPRMFKTTIPPTTKPVAGIPGIAYAQQPLQDGWAAEEVAIPHLVSFGNQLSSSVAAAFKKTGPTRGAFFRAVEENFQEKGMDPNKPWQYLLSRSQREAWAGVEEAGNAARRRRGKI